ncbi:uncharacterized protein LOC122505894 [Leptopilina heterotoma]|uniref:uncharacterized protein LOC122505894 n=1 Tax=Leptopilina heterotoma TaxID=63436 RepID=UPI001CA93388|nr:uncharacterized protein LOC122505894 [Leptopilina heterotoma]
MVSILQHLRVVIMNPAPYSFDAYRRSVRMPTVRTLNQLFCLISELGRLMQRAQYLQEFVRYPILHASLSTERCRFPILHDGPCPDEQFIRNKRLANREEFFEVMSRVQLLTQEMQRILRRITLHPAPLPTLSPSSFGGNPDRFCVCGRYFHMQFNPYRCRCGHETVDPSFPRIMVRNVEDGIPTVCIEDA